MPQQLKAADELLKMFDGVIMVAGTTGSIAAHDSTGLDLGAADVDEENPGEIIFTVTTDLTSGGSATLLLEVLDATTLGGTYAVLTPVAVNTVALDFDDASMLADAVAFRFPLPKFGVRQFIKLRYTIATATVTGGVIEAWFSR